MPDKSPWLLKEESTALRIAKRREERLVGRLRQNLHGPSEANEKLSHGADLVSQGRARFFAMLDDHPHGAAHLSVWLPQPFGHRKP